MARTSGDLHLVVWRFTVDGQKITERQGEHE